MRGRHVHALWASVGLTWLAHAGAGTFGCHPDAEVGLGSGECCDSCVAARKVLLACHGRCPPPPLQLSWYHWEVDDAFASPEDPNPKQLPPPEAPRLLAMAPGVGWNTTTEEEFRGMALQVWGWGCEGGGGGVLVQGQRGRQAGSMPERQALSFASHRRCSSWRACLDASWCCPTRHAPAPGSQKPTSPFSTATWCVHHACSHAPANAAAPRPPRRLPSCRSGCPRWPLLKRCAPGSRRACLFAGCQRANNRAPRAGAHLPPQRWRDGDGDDVAPLLLPVQGLGL